MANLHLMTGNEPISIREIKVFKSTKIECIVYMYYAYRWALEVHYCDRDFAQILINTSFFYRFENITEPEI